VPECLEAHVRHKARAQRERHVLVQEVGGGPEDRERKETTKHHPHAGKTVLRDQLHNLGRDREPWVLRDLRLHQRPERRRFAEDQLQDRTEAEQPRAKPARRDERKPQRSSAGQRPLEKPLREDPEG